MIRLVLALGLFLTCPLLAQERRAELRGIYQTPQGALPLLLVRAPLRGDGGGEYGGVLVHDRVERLILRDVSGAWQLERRERVPETAGIAGRLGNPQGREIVERWRWSEPRAVTLNAHEPAVLRGNGFVIQHPDTPQPERTHRIERELGAAPPSRPAFVIGHRGKPTTHAENTIPSLEAAIADGADGVEIDLCLTRDGQIALWHDSSPGELVALVRNLGFEGGMAYMPNFPALGSDHRRPVHELDLVDLRDHYGYSERRFTLGSLDPDEGIVIPTLAEAAPVLARLEKLILDVKVPELSLIPRFAARLLAVLEANHLVERSIVIHPDEEIVEALQGALGERLTVAHDLVILRLWGGGDPADYSGVASALAHRSGASSVGRPRLMLWGGWDLYSGILRHDRARIESEGLQVFQLAWTLDDEDELREALAIGVDGVITNDPALARRVAQQVERR